MIGEGERAPAVDLPAVVDGERKRVDLASSSRRSIVVLAFYPGDFNPACDGDRPAIADLEVLAMQPGVDVLAVSGDSLHSHRAFAAEYGLSFPLLSDHQGEVAAAYDTLAEESPAHLVSRAVVVIEPGGEVSFTWAGEDPAASPPVERLRTAVDEAGGADLAAARYRAGHDRYHEGRAALEQGLDAIAEEAWSAAGEALARADAALSAAGQHFEVAAGFGERNAAVEHAEVAASAATLHRKAADWLADAANYFAAGNGTAGESARRDADDALDRARDHPEPLGRSEFPPVEPPDTENVARGEPAGDLDDVVPADITPDGEPAEPPGDGGVIDDAELEEITAAVEEQVDED